MFKIIPIVASVAIAGAGALAMSAQNYFNGVTPNVQTFTNVQFQNQSFLPAQNDVDLFLDANGINDLSNNSGFEGFLHINVNTHSNSTNNDIQSGLSGNSNIDEGFILSPNII